MRNLVVLVLLSLLCGCSFGKVTQGEPIGPVAEPRAALLVIDIQEGLSGELSTHWFYKGYVEQSAEFIPQVNRAIVAAESMPVVYIYHEETNPLLAFLTGHQFDPGAPAAAIDSRVNVVSDNLFTKTVMDGFSNPVLHEFLQDSNINTLYVTGLDAAFCVDRTTRAALQRGYSVTVISDAVISGTVARRDRMLKKYAKRGMGLISVAEFENR